MIDRFRFILSRLRERLWLRPLALSILSIVLVFLAKGADFGGIPQYAPKISAETIEALLKVISTSMLVIATFAVGSMVAAYASASATATPRSFPLVISDDTSQNALSSFIGAFVFSIAGLIALMNGLYGRGGRFALFCLTLLAFTGVILTFVRWMDRIARLGRLGTTIDKAEAATDRAFRARRKAPTLGGVPVQPRSEKGIPVYGDTVGYVQRIEIQGLQEHAEEKGVRFEVAALPGTFSMPGRPLAFIVAPPEVVGKVDHKHVAACFEIGDDRTFDDDPRFGLIVLSEIASRAMSPAVNDPGTAIDIINSFVRLFVLWSRPVIEDEKDPCICDRIEVPELSIRDMFDDAFTAPARDAAGAVEVGIRLQKALDALAKAGAEEMREAAGYHARMAIARADEALDVPEDKEAIRAASMFAGSPS